MQKFLTITFIFLLLPSVLFGRVKTDWLFIYYMPYDNDLSLQGSKIIKMIKEGIKSDKVQAVVQADFAGEGGSYRFSISAEKIDTIKIEEEASAQYTTYQDYLNWVQQYFDFEKSVIIFLDHGGKLDELCLDEYPQQAFLKIDELAKVLEDFNQKRGKKIDLLFMQVCTKGVLEVVYELKDIAHYSLASQTLLKAPNYYYTPLFETLSKENKDTGLEIAQLIAEYETLDMYDSYTCINHSKFDRFSDLFKDFLHHYQKKTWQLTQQPITAYYAGEEYYDVSSFLRNLTFAKKKASESKRYLQNWIKEELIGFHKINPKTNISNIKQYCGLSIYRHLTDAFDLDQAPNYSHLRFFKDFKFKAE